MKLTIDAIRGSVTRCNRCEVTDVTAVADGTLGSSLPYPVMDGVDVSRLVNEVGVD